MSSSAQIQANRENAALSSGPRTEEGKAISSLNNLKHGFCGSFRVLSDENVEAWHELLAALRAEHHPGTPTEHILVERMAQHHWLAQRALSLQASLLGDDDPGLNAEKVFALYLRYQTANERAFSKCLHDLLKLRSERRRNEIGFEREKQRAAEEARKQERHKAKTGPANARAGQELGSEIKPSVEAPLPKLTEISTDPGLADLPQAA